ncbi:hypothetical protein DFJ58DRAFT_814543 [Suillus subalutaceus]|uniref:uncharacterized protein n=1 Tax=Suillus subalutaceus TaxID=48586 RepID=UPI001B8680A6|nr:uncharacterized protein DFJ58DRAFT_814543 [Suillus subalutaceus]KAG1838192.1 hypothetical protein DFJ58DRAFT_814543 [Suillus subalutaceus]
MELPVNMMTRTAFCERAKTEFIGIPNVEIIVRNEGSLNICTDASTTWESEKDMRILLSVTQGADQPASHYKDACSKDAQPLAFVGKGISFDIGGIRLKPSADMKLMRGDMGIIRTELEIVSSLLAIAQLQLPINIVTVTPTCPAPKPSSQTIIYAMNGRSVEVDNMDAEGRLVLVDALYYTSAEFKPHTVIDVATLIGAAEVALGEIYTGVFTVHLRNRLSRMLLDEDYGKPAGSCTAALFLKAFVDGIKAKDGQEPSFTRPPYQEKGMTGRPVRALV